jgi:hypothetical protein
LLLSNDERGCMKDRTKSLTKVYKCGRGADSRGTSKVRRDPPPPIPRKLSSSKVGKPTFEGLEEFISSNTEACITPIQIYAADKDYQLFSINALPSLVFVQHTW